MIVYLALVYCLNADCSKQSVYIRDTFESVEVLDAMDDCKTLRSQGRAYIARNNIKDAEVQCWTADELANMGLVK